MEKVSQEKQASFNVERLVIYLFTNVFVCVLFLYRMESFAPILANRHKRSQNQQKSWQFQENVTQTNKGKDVLNNSPPVSFVLGVSANYQGDNLLWLAFFFFLWRNVPVEIFKNSKNRMKYFGVQQPRGGSPDLQGPNPETGVSILPGRKELSPQHQLWTWQVRKPDWIRVLVARASTSLL